MPDYKYICLTMNGEYLRGEYFAKSKNHLAWTLWHNHLFLMWWEELHEELGTSQKVINPQPIPHNELADIWQDIFKTKSSAVVPGKPPDMMPLYFLFTQRHRAAVVLAIIALLCLFRIPLASAWQNYQDHARFRQTVEDMRQIAEVAKADQEGLNTYAPQVMPGMMPETFVKRMAIWPKPSCENWVYAWDNWTGVPGGEDTVRVTLRDAHLYSVYYLCVNTSGNCSPELMWSHGTSISDATERTLTCRENS
jgi:hypothetical protein